MDSSKRDHQTRSFLSYVGRWIGTAIGLLALYLQAARITNALSRIVSGTTSEPPGGDPLPGGNLLPSYAEFLGSEEMIEQFVWCIALGAIVYLAFEKLFCEDEWVRKRVSWKRCKRRKCKWYQVGCHLKKLYCYIVEAIRWVVQKICQYLEVVIATLVVICVILSIILFLMALGLL